MLLFDMMTIGNRLLAARKRTDEGRACGCCPLKGDHANSALISRLRAAASPEGEAFRAYKEPSPLGGEGVRGSARGRMRGEPAEAAR